MAAMSDEAARPKRAGLRIGRVFGVPVIISPTWFVLAVLITILYSDVVASALPHLSALGTYVVSFGFVITLCGSVFLHELGHALTSKYYRIKVNSITLEMLGGHTEMATEADRPKVEAIVSLAGPLVSAVLGVIGIALFIVVPKHTIGAQFAFQFAVCNVLVAVYNILPGLPLDGGRALRAIVWAVKKDKHLASRVSGWTGRAVAAFTAIGGVALYLLQALTLLGLVFALMVAGVLWWGATNAIQIGALGARFHLLSVGALTRPAVMVPRETPLAEVLRQVGEQGAFGAFVVDSAGNPTALMHTGAVKAVPPQRRPWVAIDDVCRTLDALNCWESQWRGERVIEAMRANPLPEYAVFDGDQAVGIVRSVDIADVLDPRAKPRRSRHTGSRDDDATDTVQQQEDHRS